MPTYDFRCPNGHEFTHFYKVMSAAQTQLPCPQCKATADRQMSAGAGFAFKGSGFYLTDYGKNAHRGGAKPSSGEKAESGGGSGAEKKADAAPAAAAATKSDAPKAESPKPKAESPKPTAESREPKAK
jgi:putative FmdB family regulatory protein